MFEDILSYFGLSHNPFPVALDPKNYYQTESSKVFLEELVHGIESRKGFLVLIGEVGVGKTSLSLQLLKLLEERRIPTSWVFNTVFTKEELLLAIARDWGLTAEDGIPFPRLVEALHTFLLDQNRAGNNCVIIVDEAHNLDATSLEALRMLSNLEFDGSKLVQTLLIGQQELHLALEEPRMRQLLSRVAIFLELPTLTREEVKGYVDFKLAKANSQMRLDGRALNRLWTATQGNLRQINLIMERALYAAIALREHQLSPAVLDLAVRDVAACNREVLKRVRKARVRRLALCGAAALFLVAGVSGAVALLLPGGERVPAPASTPAPVSTPPPAPIPAAAPVPAAALVPVGGPPPSPAEQQPRKRGVEPAQEPPASGQKAATPAPSPDRSGPKPEGEAQKPEAEAMARVIPGYNGPEVRSLQRLLTRTGHYQGAPDGTFGKKSWYALSEFQRENGLTPSGLPDPETLARLREKASAREVRP